MTTIEIDQDKAREEQVDSALILAEITGEELTREQAVRQAAQIQFMGTITMEFTIAANGLIDRKVETIRSVSLHPQRGTETRFATTRVERRDAAELSQ